MICREKITSLLSIYILPIGLLVFLTGLGVIESRSSYHSILYLLVSLPTAVITLLKPELLLTALKTNTFRLFSFLIFFAAISTLWNDQATDNSRYIRYLINIILFVLAFSYVHYYNKGTLEKTLLLAASIWGIVGLIEIVNIYYLQGKPLSHRITGSGSLSNTLLSSHIYGAFTAFLASYFLVQSHSKPYRIIIILTLLLLSCFILLTHSRTPLLGLSAVFLVLLLTYRNKKALFFLAIISSLAMFYICFNLDLITQRGLSYRPEIWSLALNKIATKPFIGHGLGSEMLLYVPSLKVAFSDSHNIHIGLTYDLGLTGLIIWALLIGCLSRIYIKTSNKLLIAVGFPMLIYGLISGLTEGSSFFTRPKEIWFLIWLPIAMIIATTLPPNRNNTNSTK